MEAINTKVHNFSAGPAILPASVMEEAAQACINFNHSGLSILEISHRSKAFEAVMEEAVALTRELLQLPDGYQVLFLSGGASTQFFMVPLNLLPEGGTAAYINTGTWASKAIEQARQYGTTEVLASSKDQNFNWIPKDFTVPTASTYLHITSNNTIFGTQYHEWPAVNIPLVADMSSDIFSRPIPVEKFGLIYAGAQKNLGPAGTTMVIVREDMLGKTQRQIPAMLDYRTHIKEGSMYNTPPVFPIYVVMLTLRWIKAMGGLAAMAKHNATKAGLLYHEIDTNPCFTGTAEVADRSQMNVCFLPAQPEWEKPFLEMASAAGIDGIKGHRSVGGFRASIYNAMPMESVQTLVDVMREFAKQHV